MENLKDTRINIYIKKYKFKFETKQPLWELPHEKENLGDHTETLGTKFPTC